MFEKISPEQAGISSKNVTAFIEKLEKRGATTHSLLFMKGDKIFAIDNILKRKASSV